MNSRTVFVGLLVAVAAVLTAPGLNRETAQAQEGSGMMGGYGLCGEGIMHAMMPGFMHRMMGREGHHGGMAEMQRMHEQMSTMHEEQLRELQGRVQALRDHTQAMGRIADDERLLEEMRTHMQMMDETLATMVEQRANMQAAMREHGQRTHGGADPGVEDRGGHPQETPEAHH